MANSNPIFVDQGASWNQMLTLLIKDDAHLDGLPMPGLDLYEPFMQVRPYPEVNGTPTTPLMLDLSLGHGIALDATTATLSFSITADESAKLTVPYGNASFCQGFDGRRIARIGSYDMILRLISDHSQVIRLMEGPFCLDARVTVPA